MFIVGIKTTGNVSNEEKGKKTVNYLLSFIYHKKYKVKVRVALSFLHILLVSNSNYLC